MTPPRIAGGAAGASFVLAMPDWLRPAFLLLGAAGNAGLFAGLFVLDYWFGDAERGARGIAVAAGVMAFALALKTAFEAPRPAGAVTRVAVSRFGFPSGHVLVATVGWGFLAADLDVGSRGARIAVAGLLVGAVALSRVVLGVHFLRDVVGGAVFGAIYLAVALAATDDGPRLGFWLAAAMGAAAAATSGFGQYGAALSGATVAGAVTWEVRGGAPQVGSTAGRVVLGFLGLPALAALGYAVTLPGLSPWLALPVGVATVVAVLAGPALVAPLVDGRVAADGG